MSIDHRYFPHIIDLIWDYMEVPALVVARKTCSDWRKRATVALLRLPPIFFPLGSRLYPGATATRGLVVYPGGLLRTEFAVPVPLDDPPDVFVLGFEFPSALPGVPSHSLPLLSEQPELRIAKCRRLLQAIDLRRIKSWKKATADWIARLQADSGSEDEVEEEVKVKWEDDERRRSKVVDCLTN